MELIREDLSLHYDPLPIARIDTGVGQAVARHILTHKHEPNGSVASISESEERLVFRHNYPAKAINCL
ncbi:hypothetical protein BAZMOX_385711_1 [methanotrophic endosymbiont of Bathymodiolus azoricus (Menez Gwen)]|nr:hypothetical protein BAZMOX_385711_1 [methanotrophic endosymbiont of Bathymodiolus azoricus (Menez Gwen)]